MNNIYESESRRGSRSRALERSLSYSEAIGNGSGRSSIDIPRIVNTDVYTNEELKKHYRISQTYVEGKEIAFNTQMANTDVVNPLKTYDNTTDGSQYSSEDEMAYGGLTMTIDVDQESPKTEGTYHTSELSTRVMVSDNTDNTIYDRIEMADFDDTTLTTGPSAHAYATPYSRRKRKGSKHKRRHGRPTRSRRVVLKDGEENVPVRSNIPSKGIKYMRDLVNTVINSKWRFLILLMVFAHFVFWLVFAGIWYAVATSYADDIGDGKQHCVNGTSSFAGLLMMSVETQMTIGYGVRFPNEECPEAIIIMVFEIVAGTALSGGLSSLLFTKLIRPNRHVSSVGFSKKASICLRDGQLCLQFRVWDLLHLHIISSNITAYIMKPIRTLEGELVKNYIQHLPLKESRAFLFWPITVVHVIDSQSPLYDFSAQDMMDYRFEIVVCLTGSSKNMGTVTQSRTSYLSKEIVWGGRFKNVLHYNKEQESYEIDIDKLDTIEQVETPLCSASRLKVFEADIKMSTPMSMSPTNLSISQDDSTLSRCSKKISSRMSMSPSNLSVSQDDSTLSRCSKKISSRMSMSPTNLSISQDDSTLSRAGESLPSSPSLNRMAGTQRSFGWNFRRFQPEKYVTPELQVDAKLTETG